MVDWNPEYIKNKEPYKTKMVGVLHIHSAGYYSEECPGCLEENSLAPNILAIDLNKLYASSSSSTENDTKPQSDGGGKDGGDDTV